MNLIIEAFIAIRSFFEAGGDVLWAILVVTTLMWTLIIERLLYFDNGLPRRVAELQAEWEGFGHLSDWQAQTIRQQLISQIKLDAHRYIGIVKTFMALLPLLGLLGTVTGMIQVFDAMTNTGTSNIRLMAGGVSAATIPTMSGLVAALSGLYLATYLEQRADREVRQAADLLVFERL